MATYKVLLPTSGTGSRLKDITKGTNKSLVLLNDRPAIEYILDSYSKDIPFVVTLGYLGDTVKAYLEKNHADRIFEFVWVDKYEGPGSSLGYSMLKAKENLQCPFVFHACDGIFVENIPAPDHNWIGGFVDNWDTTELPVAEYTSHTIENEKLSRINPRGVPGFDSIHIGLDGIKDYESWWRNLESIYNTNKDDTQISDVGILNAMLKEEVEFTWIPYKIWLDTGNLTAIKKAEDWLSMSK